MFISIGHLRHKTRLGLLSAMLALLGGCSAVGNGCNEFATPSDRLPTSCPQPAKTPIAATQPKQYCYQSLGEQSDCYAAPIPGRPGFVGTYPTPGS
jgi:hypothetical protein